MRIVRDRKSLKHISINPKYVHKKGLLVGGEHEYLILNDLTGYGWISEEYIQLS